MKACKHIRHTIDIIFLALLVSLVPLQYVVATWGTPSYTLCTVYSSLLLIGFFFVRRYYYKKLQALTTDTETGFFSRAVFDTTKLPDDLSYILLIQLPNLDSFLACHGLEAEQEAVERIAQFISFAFQPLSTDIYRYRDRSLVILVVSDKPLNEVVSMTSMAVRRISQYPIPFPQFSYELRAILHVGVVQVTEELDRAKYIEYARFSLQTVENMLEPSVRIFDKNQFDAYVSTLSRQRHIPDVIYNEQVNIVFQPIQKCSTGELFGYEALGRPKLPIFNHIGELLADAEASGFYINLELCLTHAAIRTFREKRTDETTRLFINFAPEAIRSEAYRSAFEAGFLLGVPAALEIVERGEVLPDVVRMLRSSAKEVSALVALDDFGTGYSNHLALLNARPDIIKVSRELLTNIDSDLTKQEIYSNIVMFARNLNTEVLAEGIETEEEYQTLLRLGMDYAQGYFIGKPQADLVDVSDRSKYLCRAYFNIEENV